jgi:glutaredoxin
MWGKFATLSISQVAGDENAKSLWKRKNGGKNELPFILVDGEPVGNIDDMDEA